MFSLGNHSLNSTGAALPGEISKQVLCSVISPSLAFPQSSIKTMVGEAQPTHPARIELATFNVADVIATRPGVPCAKG
jgi:hypothetical protein